MSTLGVGVATLNYCAYSIFRGVGVQCMYSTRKSSGIYPCNIPFTPKVCPGVGKPNNSDESSKSGYHENCGQIVGPAGTERPTFLGVPRSVCCFATPAALVYDLALASMGQTPCALAPNASVVSYDLTANSSSLIPDADGGVGFQLPELIFDDVFRSSPGTMVEMQGRKKQKRTVVYFRADKVQLSIRYGSFFIVHVVTDAMSLSRSSQKASGYDSWF